jgi:HlyD family type I secretion membrane fusion protein
MPDSITRPLRSASYGLIIAIILLSIWAAYAPLITTIRASGTLISAEPSYDIQHSYGGRIRKVHVSSQKAVEKGQILFELDVRKQEKIHAEITSQISSIKAENVIIYQMLTFETPRNIPATPSVTILRYAEIQKQLSLDIHTERQTVTTNQQRIKSIETGIDILIRRRVVISKRSKRLNALVKKGILAKIKAEDRSDQILSLDGKINIQRAQLISLQAQSDQAKLELQKLSTQFRVSLLNQLTENETRLPDLRRQSLVLEDEIKSATIRSPISGTAVFVGYNTNQMFVARGTTLVTLSQNMTQPIVQLLIPTQAIDQVGIGMMGKLTIPSFPQRNFPKIRIRLKSISPDAAKDSDGNPIGYRAQASIFEEDLHAANESLNGDFHLVTDMPVSVALDGRKITFSQYLIAPFFAMFQGALQD